ncbi:MAG: hypothetical protein ACC654_00875 [Acidimicrobiia bacterium]
MKFLLGLTIAGFVALLVVLKVRQPAQAPPPPRPGSWEPTDPPVR